MRKAIYVLSAVVVAAIAAGAITLKVQVPNSGWLTASNGPLNVLDSSASVLSREELQSLFEGLSDKTSDPVAAQVRNLARANTAGMVCGEVNAKNRLGGYIGFVPFIAGVALPRALIVMPTREVVEKMPQELKQIQKKWGCPAT